VELPEQTASAPLSIDAILERGIELRASDVHLTAGSPPAVRVHGHIELLHEFGELQPDDVRQLLYRITTTEMQKKLEIERQLDFAYGLRGKARFRVNTYASSPPTSRRWRISVSPRRSTTSRRSRGDSFSSPDRPARASRPRSRR
jgi:twitching motility protein PilT